MELVLEQTQQDTSYEVSVSAEGVEELKRKVKIKGEKKEALLILWQKLSGSIHKLSETLRCCLTLKTVMDPVTLCTTLPSHSRLYTSAGNPVKEILLKLNLPDHRILKDGHGERYEHVGPEVTSSQDGKVYKMVKRDYAWLMISRCSRSHSRQVEEQAQDLKSMITTSNHKLMIEVKRAQD
ncbi:hypothetical protein Tco_1119953 [Tanacetum coccineum]